MALSLAKIKSKLDGKELDLSVLELKDIPVKELAAIPKATHLDLSVNYLTTIQPAFCNLTHLVKLDLSKNRIKELPENFGQLENLQHLDLFSNSLTILPESFYNLTNLKWLDLKNNPLNAQLKAVAGECLTSQECHSCAKKVVKFMTAIHNELEKEREKKLLKEQAKAAQKQKREEAKKEKARQEKKAAKDKRREEVLKKQLSEKQTEKSENKANGVHSGKNNKVTPKDKKNTKTAKLMAKKKKSTIWFWLLPLMAFIFTFLIWRYLGSSFPHNLTKEEFHKATQRLSVDAHDLYHLSTVIGADVVEYLKKLLQKTSESVNSYWQPSQ